MGVKSRDLLVAMLQRSGTHLYLTLIALEKTALKSGLWKLRLLEDEANRAFRYLTAVDGSYYAALSEASKQSLRFQGGPFEGEELEMFKLDPLKDEMVNMRRWDDQAKVVGIEQVTPRAESYRAMIQTHLESVQAYD